MQLIEHWGNIIMAKFALHNDKSSCRRLRFELTATCQYVT